MTSRRLIARDIPAYITELEQQRDVALVALQEIKRAAIEHGVNDEVGVAIAHAELVTRAGRRTETNGRDPETVPDEMVPLVAHEARAMLQDATIVRVRHVVSLRDDVDRLELMLARGDGRPRTVRISSRPSRSPLVLRHSEETG